MNKEEILKKVKKFGYAKIECFFNQLEVDSLKNKLTSIYEKIEHECQIDIPGGLTPKSYSTGKSIRIYPSAYNNFSELSKFKNPFFSELSDDFFEGCFNKGLQTFSSYEYLCESEVKSLPRNSHMHIDPYHSLKFFSYLTDTNEDNGSLKIIPETSWIGKKIRKENNVDNLLTTDSYTFSKSKYYNEEIENSAIFIEGKAGDLIVLDTDVVHCGGIIKMNGLERMSIIYHNRK
jgi:hypothetical protein